MKAVTGKLVLVVAFGWKSYKSLYSRPLPFLFVAFNYCRKGRKLDGARRGGGRRGDGGEPSVAGKHIQHLETGGNAAMQFMQGVVHLYLEK